MLFLWKFYCGYLSTGEQLFLKNCNVPNVCAFCSDIREHRFHLFVDCVFAIESWREADICVVNGHQNHFISWLGNMFDQNR